MVAFVAGRKGRMRVWSAMSAFRLLHASVFVQRVCRRRPAFQCVWLAAFRLHVFQCVSGSHAGFNLCVLAAPAFCVMSLACLWEECSCAVVLRMSLTGSLRAQAPDELQPRLALGVPPHV